MKQIIKSAIVYVAELPSASALREHLEMSRYVAPMSLQAETLGFEPREDGGDIVEEFAGGLCFNVRVGQKILPTSVIREVVADRVKEITESTGRKPGKKERSEIKQEVLESLLPLAFVRTTNVPCFYKRGENYLIIPAPKKLASLVVSELVQAVGSVKTTTINVADVKGGLTVRMSKWLTNDDMSLPSFDNFSPCGEAVMEREGKKVSVKMDDLADACAALKEALASQFMVKSLGFLSPAGTCFKLTDEFHLKGIAVANPDDGEEEMDTSWIGEATLEVAEIGAVLTDLCTMLGYKEEAPEE